jgi:hypothetical protein
MNNSVSSLNTNESDALKSFLTKKFSQAIKPLQCGGSVRYFGDSLRLLHQGLSSLLLFM